MPPLFYGKHKMMTKKEMRVNYSFLKFSREVREGVCAERNAVLVSETQSERKVTPQKNFIFYFWWVSEASFHPMHIGTKSFIDGHATTQ